MIDSTVLTIKSWTGGYVAARPQMRCRSKDTFPAFDDCVITGMSDGIIRIAKPDGTLWDILPNRLTMMHAPVQPSDPVIFSIGGVSDTGIVVDQSEADMINEGKSVMKYMHVDYDMRTSPDFKQN
jgi:hypothetical protein